LDNGRTPGSYHERAVDIARDQLFGRHVRREPKQYGDDFVLFEQFEH
jgi:hypothetical protein